MTPVCHEPVGINSALVESLGSLQLWALGRLLCYREGGGQHLSCLHAWYGERGGSSGLSRMTQA